MVLCVMTREQTKALLPVLKAWADGKEIECREWDSDRWYVFQALSAYFESEQVEWRVSIEEEQHGN